MFTTSTQSHKCRANNGSRQEIARKRRGKLTRGVLLLKDNAPAHTSFVAMTAATECGFEILLHPPFFPYMAPSDFYQLPKLKSHLHGTQYGSNEGVIGAVNKYLGDQENAFYFERIRKMEQKYAKCIALKVDHIENNGHIFILWLPKVQGAGNFYIISRRLNINSSIKSISQFYYLSEKMLSNQISYKDKYSWNF